MPLVEPGAPEVELRFEVVQDDDGSPRVYGVELPRGWPIGTPFPKDAPRLYVPVNELRFKADVGMADRLTLIALGSQVRLAGECGPIGGEQTPTELHGFGIFPQLEVIQDGNRRGDIASAAWSWDARERRAKLLLGLFAAGAVGGG